MGRFDRTWREVDGERIEGSWRQALFRNGDHYSLGELKIYADGVVYCQEAGTLAEFAAKVRCGCVVTELPDGVRLSAHHLGSWTVTGFSGGVDADGLIGEVADEVERLAGRPTSTDRCLRAVEEYLSEQTEDNRLALRAAYLAIPAHLRVYALGDMDAKDGPLRALAFDSGASQWQAAIAYFVERDEALAEFDQRVPADGPERSELPTITIPGTVYPSGWPADPGIGVLQDNFPAPITVGGRSYPTVIHAYWALSTADEGLRARIAETENPYQARKIGEEAPRRPGWAEARVAVMTGLLRAKFRQHPELAEVLLATGDAQLVSNEHLTPFWRRWVARLLEVVRAELAAERAGISELG